MISSLVFSRTAQGLQEEILIFGRFFGIFWGPHAKFGQLLKAAEAEYSFRTNFELQQSKIMRTDSEKNWPFCTQPLPLLSRVLVAGANGDLKRSDYDLNRDLRLI